MEKRLRRLITSVLAALSLALVMPQPLLSASAPAQQTQKKGGTTAKKSTKQPTKPTKAAKSSKNAKPSKSSKTGKQKVAAKQPVRTQQDVKREQKATTEDIKKTTAELKENKRNTAKQLNRLNDLHARIDEQNRVIAQTRAQADTLETHISTLADTIASLRDHVDKLRIAYANVLKKSQPWARSTDQLTFIFSAESFNQAVQRMRYMQRVKVWRERKAKELQTAVNKLSNQQATMEALLRRKSAHIVTLNTARAAVERDSKETSRIVADLQRQGSALQQHLNDQQQKLRRLDQELDRIIAAEQERIRREREAAERAERERIAREKRQAEERRRKEQEAAAKAQSSSSTKQPTTPAPTKEKPIQKPKAEPEVREAAPLLAYNANSSNFEALKGRLPFPVDGKYRVISTFGRHPHPDVPNVQVDNSGIDIEMVGATQRARAIADGTISAVFRQPGYSNIVMVRHGEYITIYAGLGSLAVKKGDTVKTGQTLGQVEADPDNDNRRVLHFELRRERDKLNPLLWVK